MKKSLLVMTALLASMSLTAGNVTEQEALRKAQQFLQGRSFQQKNLRVPAEEPAPFSNSQHLCAGCILCI